MVVENAICGLKRCFAMMPWEEKIYEIRFDSVYCEIAGQTSGGIVIETGVRPPILIDDEETLEGRLSELSTEHTFANN